MTDNEIKKAFMICNNLEDGYCSDCPFEYCDRCIRQVAINTLDLINRYEAENDEMLSTLDFRIEKILELEDKLKIAQAENERLTHITRNLIGEIKAEAYTEFAELLKETFPNNNHWVRPREMVDNLLKEMVGE